MAWFGGVNHYGLFGIWQEPVVVITLPVDWLVEDMMLACEERISKRFAEMGVSFEVNIPKDLPEPPHYPRRPRSVWG